MEKINLEEFLNNVEQEYQSLGFKKLEIDNFQFSPFSSFPYININQIKFFEENGNRIGEIDFNQDESNPEILTIDSLNVNSNMQGKGFGKKIVLGLEKTAKEFEFKGIELTYLNIRAKSFWNHMGYSIVTSPDMVKYLNH